jgi:hypothetical protein
LFDTQWDAWDACPPWDGPSLSPLPPLVRKRVWVEGRGPEQTVGG